MEPNTRRCMKCAGLNLPAPWEPKYACRICGFDNHPWIEEGLPVWILAVCDNAAAACARMNDIDRERGRRWYPLDCVERLFGLKRALIWRFDDYYLRNDLLVVEAYITVKRYTYVEAPIQPSIAKRGREA